MEFVHRPGQMEETIAAVATPPGEGGVAIIRISGKEAVSIAQKIFIGDVHSYKSHTAHYGKIIDCAGDVVDEVLLLPMRAPRSYTGEDTVEIHCHGGSLITKKVLETAFAAGARAAMPGEFTFRAFMHGKIDLAQAEAVQELIHAQNTLALNFAQENLQGALSREISSLQHALTDTAAILEAWVDFPEEGLEFATKEEILSALETTCARMEKLLASFHEGKKIHDGISLCLIGPPNAGKSSLMNALLGKDRAIVTPIAGTTRDLLEEDLLLGSLHFRLMDTAGIRATEEVIEQEGILRTQKALKNADLVLLILDASRGLESPELLEKIHGRTALLVWNKIDLVASTPASPLPSVAISAKEGTGIGELKEAISSLVWKQGPPSKQEVLLTSARHKQALEEACAALQTLIHGLKTNVSPEFLTSDLRSCLSSLGQIIGTNVTEDILTKIFSKFCVGK